MEYTANKPGEAYRMRCGGSIHLTHNFDLIDAVGILATPGGGMWWDRKTGRFRHAACGESIEKDHPFDLVGMWEEEEEEDDYGKYFSIRSEKFKQGQREYNAALSSLNEGIAVYSKPGDLVFEYSNGMTPNDPTVQKLVIGKSEPSGNPRQLDGRVKEFVRAYHDMCSRLLTLYPVDGYPPVLEKVREIVCKGWLAQLVAKEDEPSGNSGQLEEKPKELKIEAGKYYKLRDGSRAFVEFRSEHTSKPWRGVIKVIEWQSASWDESGAWAAEAYPDGSELDIIAEWEEPKPEPRVVEQWVSMIEKKTIYAGDRLNIKFREGNEEYHAAKVFFETGLKEDEILIDVRKIRHTEGGKIEDITDEG